MQAVAFEDPAPISPPASPPVSGGSGVLGGLSTALQGPAGLVATASGVGLIFLWGSSRTTEAIDGRRRDDEDEGL